MTSTEIRFAYEICKKKQGGNGSLNTLRPRQNGRHFADDIFECILLNENVWIPIKISLKFVPRGPINNIPALVQIMGWRRPGDKPLSGPMMVRLPTHIYVTRPQWVNWTIGRKNSLTNKRWVPSDWKINEKKTNLKYKVIDETCSRYDMIRLTYCTCVCLYFACGCVADMQDTGCAPYHATIAENHVFDCSVCSY